MTRKSIPDATQDAILTKSRRRCCLCYWLDDRKVERPGQIAHLDQDHENFTEGNLVWLCVDHHDRYDSTTSQTKGYRESEVRHWRDKLYAEFAPIESEKTAPTELRAVHEAPSIAGYTQDTFFDVVWRWKWKDLNTDDPEPTKFKAYCPDCDLELSFNGLIINLGPGPNWGAKWGCTYCRKDWPGYDPKEIAKHVLMKKRSGEWKSLVK